MKCKFYIPRKELNAVTTYYTEIMVDAAKKAGFDVEMISDVKDISHSDCVVTIANHDFLKASRRKPAKQIHWFQGIIPEEAAMTFKGHWSKWPRIWKHRLLERYILRHSDLNLFVSNAMKEHFARIYGKIKGEDIIMPCFNAELQEDSFTEQRYQNPTFVYAGSLHKWQCFEPMLDLFKKIQEQHPSAKLDIFTAEKEKAAEMARKHGVNVSIDCLSPDELNKRLTQYKYGFIIREDDPVNNVASPTKMNTYVAAGIIPVASNVVDTYRINLSKYPHILLFNSETEMLSRIADIEATPLEADKLQAEFQSIFSSFWNREQYTDAIASKIKKLEF